MTKKILNKLLYLYLYKLEVFFLFIILDAVFPVFTPVSPTAVELAFSGSNLTIRLPLNRLLFKVKIGGEKPFILFQ